ncbi:uncharacterized protein [Rhodnius prolixus]|uniref:uncharacterized protein n=1 Tax=Rhodnius prolixus TaxID=13249 RepID=UPI003D18906B
MNLNVHRIPGTIVLRMGVKADGRLLVWAPRCLDITTLRLMIHFVYNGEFRSIIVKHHRLQPTWIHTEFQVHRKLKQLRRGEIVACGRFLELRVIGSEHIILLSHRRIDKVLTSWILQKTLFPGEVVFQFCTSVAHDVWFHIRAWQPFIVPFSYFERSRAIRAGDVLYVYNRMFITHNDIPAIINLRSGVQIKVIFIRQPMWQMSNGRS